MGDGPLTFSNQAIGYNLFPVGGGLAGRVKVALLPSISRKTDVSVLQTLVRMLA